MRILHLLAPAPFGGLERVVQSLAFEQARSGHDVHAAAILDPGVTDHPVLAALEAHGVGVHPLTIAARAYRLERALVRRVCEDVRPDVVHTHGYRVDVLHSPVARSLGIATVATAHGFVGGDWKNSLYEYIQRRAFRRCDAVVAVSRPMRDGLIESGIPPERVHCVPNAWADPIPFLPRAEARRTLGIDSAAWCAGFIGRISREKGPDTFIDALAALMHGERALAAREDEAARADTNGVRAVLVGEGRMRDELMQRTDAPDIGGAVQWPGAIENAGRLIRAFDVVVLSSRTEGTPMVLLEAMAAGVPVIATRVGGIPDVVSHEEALLVPADDPQSLATALRMVWNDPQAAALRSTRAAERLHSEFSATVWRERYDEVYRSCLDTPVLAPA